MQKKGAVHRPFFVAQAMTAGPFIFGFYSLAHAAFALAALSLLPFVPWAVLALFVVESITAYDNLIIVLGRRIGVGAVAQRLNRQRFFLHAVCIGLLVPVYVSIGAALDGAGMNSQGFAAAGWLAAALIGGVGFSLQYRKLRRIMPINYYGCLRYAQSVHASRRYPGYEYSDSELAQKPAPPLASIVTVFIGLVISCWVGWSTGFWLPFAATAFMLSAAALPAETWGPLLTSAIEVLFSAALVYSLAVVI